MLQIVSNFRSTWLFEIHARVMKAVKSSDFPLVATLYL